MMTDPRASRRRNPMTIRRRFAVAALVLVAAAACTPEELALFDQLARENPTAATAVLEHLTTPAPPKGTTLAGWARLRNCESGDRVNAVSPSGSYHGLYQFNQRTWNGVASAIDPRWVGVRPSAAPRSVQTRMAYALFEARGRGPWPVCGLKL